MLCRVIQHMPDQCGSYPPAAEGGRNDCVRKGKNVCIQCVRGVGDVPVDDRLESAGFGLVDDGNGFFHGCSPGCVCMAGNQHG